MNQTSSDSPQFGEAPVFVGSAAGYHQALTVVDDLIEDLRDYTTIFTPRQKNALFKLSGSSETNEIMTVDDVTAQFMLVKKIRTQLVDPTGKLLDGADIRVIAALVSSINSLISLFLKSSDRIKELKQVADLKAVVIEAIMTLDKASQERFFARLDALAEQE